MILVDTILLLVALRCCLTAGSLTDAIEKGIEETPVINNLIPGCVFGVDSVSFILFTREFPDGKPIGDNDTDLAVDGSTKIIIMCHGFISDANNTNFYNLQSTILDRINATVLSLDWTNSSCSTGLLISDLLSYGAAVNNVPAVGERLGRFILFLKNYYNVDPRTVSGIGHSLGAHVLGFAGKYIKKLGTMLGNIAALDPAGVLFQGKDCSEILCKGDAVVVQAIKTTTLYGMDDINADIVTVMNGGSQQPGCSTTSCSHSRAAVIYKDSIECSIIGIRDNTLDKETYEKEVSECTSKTCIKVGPAAFHSGLTGTFYALTNAEEPLCLDTSSNF